MKDRHFDNDNEPNPFSAIGLHAALIVNKLRCQAQLTERTDEKDVTENPNASGERTNEERDRAKEEYVQQRLRDIRAFERRARGLSKK